MTNNKRIILAVGILTAFIIAAILGNFIHTSLTSIEVKITHDENDYIVIETNLNKLKEKNIEYGDSVKVLFSSAYTAEEVPVLNGEFMNTGQHILVAEDENAPLKFYIQGYVDFWNIATLNENSTVKLSLTEKGKYKDLFNAFNMPITGDIKNLRSLRGGNLKLLDIFRGANPKTNYDVESTLYYYYKNISIQNKINLDDNAFNVHSIDIKNKDCNYMIIDRLLQICQLSGRTYIYSNTPDMTAYFCAIIEAIGGASYDEIVSDYMETYKNLYGITFETNPNEYNAIKTYHIDWFLHKLTKTPSNYDMHRCDFAYDAEMYLRAIGLGTAEINLIKSRLCN